MLEHSGIEIKKSIEEAALNKLVDNADIDYILVGMRRTKYVNALIDL